MAYRLISTRTTHRCTAHAGLLKNVNNEYTLVFHETAQMPRRDVRLDEV